MDAKDAHLIGKSLVEEIASKMGRLTAQEIAAEVATRLNSHPFERVIAFVLQRNQLMGAFRDGVKEGVEEVLGGRKT